MRTMVISLLLAAAAGIPIAQAEGYTRNVAIVLYEGVEVLDFAGPAEVFAAASGFGRSAGKPAFNVYTMGVTRDPIVSQGFIDVTPDYSIADAPKPDVIVIPGGSSASLSGHDGFMKWLAATAPGAELSLTVCTGAFVLAKAGILDGRDATTFYRAVENLRASAPNARIHAGRRFIDSGTVITTAGVSAGIDGSLHAVARLLGRRIADRTAEYMEYHWTPEPYLAMSYPLLNPSVDDTGRALQQAQIAMDEGRHAEAERQFAALTEVEGARHEALYGVATARFAAKQYEASMEAYLAASEDAGLRGGALYNAACAAALAGRRDRALELAEKAVAAGMRHRMSYESDRDLDSIRGEPRFQALLAGL